MSLTKLTVITDLNVLGYNVTSIINVIFYQIFFFIGCPFLALKEFVEVIKTSYVRDLGRGKYAEKNQVGPLEKEKITY